MSAPFTSEPPKSQPNPAPTEDFYQEVDIPMPEGLATLRFTVCRRCASPVLDRYIHDKFHKSLAASALGF